MPVTLPVSFTRISTNGISLRVALGGEGPLVVLLHGFPETWWSWRHQIPALVEAGFRVAAVEQRGYGQSDAPHPIEAYDTVTLAEDIVGILKALGAERAHIVGHDWGSLVAWHFAWLHPELTASVTGMSVPWFGRGEVSAFDMLDRAWAGRFFYIRYFQAEGVAEAAFDADPARALRTMITYFGSRDLPTLPDDGRGLLDLVADPGLPAWLSPEDFAPYVEAFEHSGFRGPLNWYRNFQRTWELTADKGVGAIDRPALFISGDADPVISMAPGMVEAMHMLVADLRGAHFFPGSHWLPMENPAPVTETLVRFLRSFD